MHDQMNLLPERRFDRPLRWSDRHYVPILKSMAGELMALRTAGDSTWDRMTPLIEAAGKAGTEEPPERSLYPNLAGRLGPAITAGRPFFLDFPWIHSGAKINIGQKGRKVVVNAIEHVFESCRSSGLAFIPVLATDRDDGRAELVKAAARRDGRGVCLRLPITGVFWPAGLPKFIEERICAIDVRPENVDLLLDLGYVKSPPTFDAGHVKRLIEALPHLDAWRSLVVAGTVIPASASGWEEGGITEIPRLEWHLYRDLRRLAPRRMPAFGDYGVQHPEPPEGGGPGMRANIRYTTQRLVLFARGFSLIEYKSDQYRDLCKMLVGRPEFKEPTYSWGDQIIVTTAASNLRPKGEPLWRAAGTSHHLRLLSDSVSNNH